MQISADVLAWQAVLRAQLRSACDAHSVASTETLAARGEWAQLLSDSGDHAAAVLLCTETLELAHEQLGECNAPVARARWRLGSALLAAGGAARGLEELAAAERVARQMLGSADSALAAAAREQRDAVSLGPEALRRYADAVGALTEHMLERCSSRRRVRRPWADYSSQGSPMSASPRAVQREWAVSPRWAAVAALRQASERAALAARWGQLLGWARLAAERRAVAAAVTRRSRLRERALDVLCNRHEQQLRWAAWQRLYACMLLARRRAAVRCSQAAACGVLLRGSQAALRRAAWHGLAWYRRLQQLREAERSISAAARAAADTASVRRARTREAIAVAQRRARDRALLGDAYRAFARLRERGAAARADAARAARRRRTLTAAAEALQRATGRGQLHSAWRALAGAREAREDRWRRLAEALATELGAAHLAAQCTGAAEEAAERARLRLLHTVAEESAGRRALWTHGLRELAWLHGIAAAASEERARRAAHCSEEVWARAALISERLKLVGQPGQLGMELRYDPGARTLSVRGGMAGGAAELAGLEVGDILFWAAVGRSAAQLERPQFLAARDPRNLRDALSVKKGVIAGSRVRLAFFRGAEPEPRETELVLGAKSPIVAAAELLALVKRVRDKGDPEEVFRSTDAERVAAVLSEPMQLWQLCADAGVPVCSELTEQEWLSAMRAVQRALGCPGFLCDADLRRDFVLCGAGRNSVPFADLFEHAREALHGAFVDADFQATAARLSRREAARRAPAASPPPTGGLFVPGGLNLSSLSASIGSLVSPLGSPRSPGAPTSHGSRRVQF
eukprot:TRINITY_DN11124_c0_g1_i1.p1 TRINITY_DN11124_c0_g1~~TRINITY_DN11124_c0_g1_i1.p1  ORF type:complete len:806 (+),score=161.92 TRINITY_DN11124_c0_g1_i1:103-2520(+)